MKKNKSEKVKIKKEGLAIKKTLTMAGAAFLFLLLATGSVFQSQVRKIASDKLVVAGNYYYNGGAYDTGKAEKLFDVALFLNPQADAADYQLARIHLVGNRLDLARTEIDKSLAINPANQRAFYIRGLIDGYAGKYSDSIADFQKFIAWSPTEWAGYNDLAWAYFLNKDFANTEKTAQTGLDKTGQNNPWLLNGLGVAYVNLGEPQKADAIFAQVKKLSADMTNDQWAKAYPGNDPSLADANLQKFKTDVNSNSQLAMEGYTSGGTYASACASSNPGICPAAGSHCSGSPYDVVTYDTGCQCYVGGDDGYSVYCYGSTETYQCMGTKNCDVNVGCTANGTNSWTNTTFTGNSSAGPCVAYVNTNVASGQTVTETNTAAGYSGSVQFTCNNGSWQGPNNLSCTASAVNGACAATHYNCSAGTPASPSASANQYKWDCIGVNGGNPAHCSECFCSASDTSQCVGYVNTCGKTCGTKLTNYVPTCTHPPTPDVCDQTNCGKSITTATAVCTNIDANGCGSPTPTNISNCSGCTDQTTTCPACSWKEVLP